METTITDIDAELANYDKKCREHFKALVGWQDFWRDALKEGIEIPYDAHGSVWNRYVNIAQHTLNDETGKYELDVDATQKMFARIIRWARKNGWTVKKGYKDDEFTVSVTDIPDPVSNVQFYSTRQVVCERVQVGTKHVEAHDEPVYEYLCDKVAFLTVEV